MVKMHSISAERNVFIRSVLCGNNAIIKKAFEDNASKCLSYWISLKKTRVKEADARLGVLLFMSNITQKAKENNKVWAMRGEALRKTWGKRRFVNK
jgi:hypothetical protein